jgi:Mn2+/Fe2+ NRAMP family transporter
MASEKQKPSWFSIIGPGILVAATGVGAGDLLTASIAGSKLGLTVLWAAVAGAFLKWTLNEGIARWQMSTGTTLLEGWIDRLGSWIQWIFVPYFLMWTVLVGGALITACGVAASGLLPLGDPTTSKNIWGVVHTLAGLALVWVGGFQWFQRLMTVCIGAMFVGVLITAVLLTPEFGAVVQGTLVPTIPPGGLGWILGVLGGVGGTVTLLSYGYWVQEKDRAGEEGLRICRIDLAVAYTLTAVFGMAMVIIGNRVQVEGQGVALSLQLAKQLELVLGRPGKWMFLVGFWGAVFSSLLGVWQSAPYIFADYLQIRSRGKQDVGPKPRLSKTPAYRWYLVAISIVPLITLWLTVEKIQLAYAVLGALFMPLLALTLLLMNTRERWVGQAFRSHWSINTFLVITLLLFAYMGLA